MEMHFRLVTPDRILIEEEVRSVSLPTAEGEVTILPHHVPFAAILVPGIVRIHREGGVEEVAVSGGFIHVSEIDRTITVLADTAERGQELTLSAIEEAKARAMQVMKEAVSKDDTSFAAAAAALERELARYKVASRHKHHGPLPVNEQSSIKKEENA